MRRNSSRRYGIIALMLVMTLLGVSLAVEQTAVEADWWHYPVPWDPIENIVTVEIWDEVVEDSTVLHVDYYTEEPSGEFEVDGWIDGYDPVSGEHFWQDFVDHPDGTIQFHAQTVFDGVRTGETVNLAAFASMWGEGGGEPMTDRAPNTCWYEYVFRNGGPGQSPDTHYEGDDWTPNPKENILTVDIWDEVVGVGPEATTYLHVEYFTEEPSGADEVDGWIRLLVDPEDWWDWYDEDADHPDGTNVFHSVAEFEGDLTETEETVFVAAYASCGGEWWGGEFDTDCAPDFGEYYEYTFGDGSEGEPDTREDVDEEPPDMFPPGVGVGPLMGEWGGTPVIHWEDTITFTYEDSCSASSVQITIDVAGEVDNPVVDAPMNWTTTDYWLYEWEPFDYHGETTVTYAVDCPDPEDDPVIEFPLLIDPSGNVFDSETGDPIQGATVTLYYSPTGLPGSFVVVTGPSPVIVPPGNPQTTDGNGHYGWDVEGGYYWKVHVEKDGYYPEDSPVVYVGDPVTNLHVYLDPRSSSWAIPGMMTWNTVAAMALLVGLAAWMLRRRRAFQSQNR